MGPPQCSTQCIGIGMGGAEALLVGREGIWPEMAKDMAHDMVHVGTNSAFYHMLLKQKRTLSIKIPPRGFAGNCALRELT